jgi:hypothetical protein
MSRLAGPVLFVAFVGLTLLAGFAEEPWISASAIGLAFLFFGLIAAAIARLVRRLRGSEPAPERRADRLGRPRDA